MALLHLVACPWCSILGVHPFDLIDIGVRAIRSRKRSAADHRVFQWMGQSETGNICATGNSNHAQLACNIHIHTACWVEMICADDKHNMLLITLLIEKCHSIDPFVSIALIWLFKEYRLNVWFTRGRIR